MLYKIFVRKMHKSKSCPFCVLTKEQIIKSNKFTNLILAKAPYSKDHLLIVPKRHVLKLNKLSKKEKEDLEKLIYWGFKKLHKKYKNVTMLYREGEKKQVGKSIDHVHVHLIPKMQIGAKKIDGNKRKIMSEKEYIKKTKEIKKLF
jgi:ATP adenylyltransferase